MNASLRLQPFMGGLSERRRTLFFISVARACQHICDHLLTPPEADLWAKLLPELRPIVSSRKTRLRLGKTMWEDEGASAQGLYDSWRTRAASQADRALALEWIWWEEQDLVYFSPRGIKVVVGPRAVKTVYFPLPSVSRLPSRMEPASDEGIVEQRRGNPFPREGRFAPAPDHAARRRDRRSRRPSNPRIEDFRIFRRTVDAVRAEFAAASHAGDATPSGLRALLRARSDLEIWETLLEERRQDA